MKTVWHIVGKKINLHERNCQKFNEICYSYQLLGFALRNKERNKCVVQENEQTQNAEIGSFKGKYSCYLHKTFQIFFSLLRSPMMKYWERKSRIAGKEKYSLFSWHGLHNVNFLKGNREKVRKRLHCSKLVDHLVIAAAFHHACDVDDAHESEDTCRSNYNHETVGHAWAPPFLFFVFPLLILL